MTPRRKRPWWKRAKRDVAKWWRKNGKSVLLNFAGPATSATVAWFLLPPYWHGGARVLIGILVSSLLSVPVRAMLAPKKPRKRAATRTGCKTPAPKRKSHAPRRRTAATRRKTPARRHVKKTAMATRPPVDHSLYKLIKSLPPEIKEGMAWGAGIALLIALFDNED
ncbi:hypothetical protein IIA16_00360 [bacterium]|nr:hypothetical protein [bacterium]